MKPKPKGKSAAAPKSKATAVKPAKSVKSAKQERRKPAAAKKNPLFIVTLSWVDCITVSGVALSSLSALFVFRGRFSFALSLLFAAMLLDAIDGVLSRRFGLERDFGRYLDGFVDVFDYLILPSIFLYHWGFNTWYEGVILIGFMMSGVVRLSVFNEIGNIKNDKKELAYLGMPVFWSVLMLGVLYTASWFVARTVVFPVIAVLYGAGVFFMVYNGRFYKFKNVKLMVCVLVGFAILFALDGFGLIPFGPGGSSYTGPVLDGGGIIAPLLTAFFFTVPPMIGGSLHMLFVSRDWLSFLSYPISERLFGANKTWRGIVLMPLLSVPGALLIAWLLTLRQWPLTVDLTALHPVVTGLLLGLGYILFELPNSFIKRRLGVKPGALPEKNRTLFVLLDQIDSTVGVTFFAWLVFPIPWPTVICMLATGPLIAYAVKQILYILRWKEESR